MKERIKSYFTHMDEGRALRCLAVGFAAVFLALVGLGAFHAYDARREKEENAWLLAADLLRMRDSMEAEQVALYGELIRGRIGSVMSEKDSRMLSEILRGTDGDALLQSVGDRLEAAVEENRFSARMLRRILLESLQTVGQAGESPDTEGVEATGQIVSPFANTVDPTEIAHRFFGVKNLFRSADSTDDTLTVSYCKNVYAVFERKSGKMLSYVAECIPGEPTLSDGDCVRAAVEYARDRHGMDKAVPGQAVASRGIYMVQLSVPRGDSVWIGVRQDTGSVCFFWRS